MRQSETERDRERDRDYTCYYCWYPKWVSISSSPYTKIIIRRFINHMQNTFTRKQMDTVYLLITAIAPYVFPVQRCWNHLGVKGLKNTSLELQLIFLNKVARISIILFLPLTAMSSVAAEKNYFLLRVLNM